MEEIALVMNGRLRKGRTVDIKEYSIDSRLINTPERTLFFALRGNNHDGHDYIAKLYDNGTRAFVVSEWRPEFEQMPEANFVTVPDVLEALQTLAAHHRRQMKAKVIGITGSNGKTITKEWLYQLLTEDFAVYRSPRSYNSQVGVPISLLGIDGQADIAIIEAGISLPGEMSRLEKMIHPDIGIFTHLGEAHEENFSSLEEKLKEKIQLFQSCEFVVGRKNETLWRATSV